MIGYVRGIFERFGHSQARMRRGSTHSRIQEQVLVTLFKAIVRKEFALCSTQHPNLDILSLTEIVLLNYVQK